MHVSECECKLCCTFHIWIDVISQYAFWVFVLIQYVVICMFIQEPNLTVCTVCSMSVLVHTVCTRCHRAAWTPTGQVRRRWVSAGWAFRHPCTKERFLIGPAAGQSLHWRQARTQQVTPEESERTSRLPVAQKREAQTSVRDMARDMNSNLQHDHCKCTKHCCCCPLMLNT